MNPTDRTNRFLRGEEISSAEVIIRARAREESLLRENKELREMVERLQKELSKTIIERNLLERLLK